MRRAQIAVSTLICLAGLGLDLVAIACSDTTSPPPAPTQLSFTSQPATSNAGSTLGRPAVVVELLDDAGRTVSSSDDMISLQLISAVQGVALEGSRNVQAVNGVATFSDLAISQVGVGFRLSATAAGLPITVSAGFDISPDVPDQLLFVAQPTTSTASFPLDAFVSVEVLDKYGNLATQATNEITISISANSAAGTLSGVTTVAAVAGVAKFSNIIVDKAGVGYSLDATAPGLRSAVSHPFDVRIPFLFSTISAGYFHSCGVTPGSAGYCWGQNADGQLGGAASAGAGPVSGGHTFSSVSAGRTHSCGLEAGGAAFCWGTNANGELGTGGGKVATPTAVAGGLAFLALTAGYSHSCGIATGGSGYCWGSNFVGELGNGSLTSAATPSAVGGGLTFSSLSPGRDFTCGLTPAHAAYCWGDNSYGELGDGTKIGRMLPVAVSGQLAFSMVAAGGFHSCGITTSGEAFCWGQNVYGQLGTGTTTDSPVPQHVLGGLTFATISVGNRHNCAITTAGIAYCWGENSTGHLGNGTSTSSSIPVPVSGGLTFASVSAGRFHTCGVTTAGAGYCWGSNGEGELGTGNIIDSRVPVRVR